jgi:hypothetical protein
MSNKGGVTALILPLILTASVTGGNACGLIGQPPCSPQGPTTIQTYGNQTFINRPNQAATTIQTYGNQSFINTPGQRTRVCSTFGNQTFCN